MANYNTIVAFLEPFESVYSQYIHLWTDEQQYYYKLFSEKLENFAKFLYIKLLLRKPTNVYNIANVKEVYWNLLYINDERIKTKKEEDEGKLKVEEAIKKLLKINFIVSYDMYCDKDYNIIKQINFNNLKVIVKNLPDGLDAIKKYKTKETLVKWIITKLQNHGSKCNTLLNKTLNEIFWNSYYKVQEEHVSEQYSAHTNLPINYKFTINLAISKFFVKVHLLYSLLNNTYDNSKDDSDTESLISSKQIKSCYNNTYNIIEYIQGNKLCFDQYANNPSRIIFHDLNELKEYENATRFYNNLFSISNISELLMHSDIAVKNIMYLLRQNIDNDTIKNYLKVNDNDFSDQYVSNPDKIQNSVHKIYTHEFVYIKSLQHILNRLSHKIHYEHTIRLGIIIYLTRMPIKENSSGENLYKALNDLYNNNVNSILLEWIVFSLTQLTIIEPIIALKIATKLKIILKKKNLHLTANNWATVCTTNEHKLYGIYERFNAIAKSKNIQKFFNLQKEIGKNIKQKVYYISITNKVGRKGRTEVLSPISGCLVSIEQYTIEAYLNNNGCYSNNWIARHSENYILLEIYSTLIFPICFNLRIHKDNCNYMLSNTQLYPINFNIDWFYNRIDLIESYLNLIQKLSKNEIVMLICFVSTFLFEISFLGNRWNALLITDQFIDPGKIFKQHLLKLYHDLNNHISNNANTTPCKSVTPIRGNINMLIEYIHTNTVNQGSGNHILRTPPSTLRKTSSVKRQLFKQDCESNRVLSPYINPILGYRRYVELIKIKNNQETLEEAVLEQLISGASYGLALGYICAGVNRATTIASLYCLLRNWHFWCSGMPDLIFIKKLELHYDENKKYTKNEYTISQNFYQLLKFFFLSETYNEIKHNVDSINVDQLFKESYITALLKSIITIVDRLNLDNAETHFVEVKAPGDTLSDKQKLWLNLFYDTNTNCHVCIYKNLNKLQTKDKNIAITKNE